MSDRKVVQNAGGGWDVETAEGRTTAADRRSPRRAMVQAREEIRATGGGVLVLEDRGGRVRQKDVIDPPPDHGDDRAGA